ncbi:hypothetical protein LTR56_015563 [Elasticomyces elasticus]|nr:hypothetical protein LTR56_015563 [Elasticomyces elasticus]KAK3648288.1 hypothetical protein LTR22_013419 [Elasticomyces elasticus]KAK4916278.1 hypothetical protein LTR49_015650 [Elasticomyces elasticus]KAK5764962.1 hypothetical protein LTS12_004990 [Elasticomyces elasticus]
MSSHPDEHDHADDYYLELDATARDLLDSVKVTRAYGCTRNGHDPKRLCACRRAMRTLTEKDKLLFAKLHWNLEWEQLLIKTEAAFDYTIDSASHNANFQRASGSSPETFARQFAEDIFAAPAMVAPANSTEESVRALLVFWSMRAAEWRSRYNNAQAAQAHLQSIQPGEPGSERWPDMSVPNPKYPPQPAKHLIVQRARAKGTPGHRSMVFMLPLRELFEGDVRSMTVGVRPCHEDCKVWRLELTPSFMHELIREMFPSLKEAVLTDRISGVQSRPREN